MPSAPTPVIFIHGLWLHAESWVGWVDLFGELGYEPMAPGWPGIPATVAETRTNPEGAGGHGLTKITNWYAEIIRSLPAEPIVIGHSFGGIVAQKLLGRGLAAAAVAIDPPPIKGVLDLPLSSLRVASVALRNPANWTRTVALSRDEFRYGFGNALSEQESADLYRRWAIPSPGRPVFESAFANVTPNSPAKVDTANPTRGPLLITGGASDHTAPTAIGWATVKRYRRSPAVTDYVEFPGRGHSLTIDHGWREVADRVLGWLKDRSLG